MTNMSKKKQLITAKKAHKQLAAKLNDGFQELLADHLGNDLNIHMPKAITFMTDTGMESNCHYNEDTKRWECDGD